MLLTPSFWFEDVVAARDEDEAIVDDCYEASIGQTSQLPGMPARAGGCRNWGLGALRPAACAYFGATDKNMRACSYAARGGGGFWHKASVN